MSLRVRTDKAVTIRLAAAIQFASKYASIGMQLAITAILARLLSPDAYGVIAIATVFVAFFSMFSDMGISTAIVQFGELSEKDYGALFFFSILVSIAISGLFCLCSFGIGAIYGNPLLTPICCALSLVLLFTTLNMVPNGLMLKERRFASIGIRLVVATMISGIVAIVAAFFGAGCYALAFQSVLSTLIVFLWNVLSRPIGCINCHFLPPLKKIFSYSFYQFGFSMVNFFSRNADNMVIGWLMGPVSAGFYSNAYKLTTLPMTAISSVLGSVIQPYMVERRDDCDWMFSGWFRVTKALSLIAAPLAAIFFCGSSEIVAIVYGAQWAESAEILQMLSWGIYAQMVGNPSGAFFQSLGKTNLMFKCGLVNTLLSLVALAIGVAANSLMVIAFFMSVSFCVQLIPMFYFLVSKSLRKSVSVFLGFIPEILIAVLSALVCVFVSSFLSEITFLRLMEKTFIVLVLAGIGYLVAGQIRHLRFNRGSC